MTRDEAAAILDLPREKAIEAIVALGDKAEKYDKLRGDINPTGPSGMQPPYLKEPGKKRRKKPGRKAGHPGVSRKRPDKIDRYTEHTLDECPNCQGPLKKPITSYKRYTVDIPPVEPEVSEHTINGYWCPGCKKTVYPKLADVMPNCTLGLNLLVLSAWLHYWVGMSVRNVTKLLSIIYSLEVSAGGLTQAWKKLAAILMPIYDDIGRMIKDSAVLNADETGWRISGTTYWLWCFATKEWCYFVIDKTRGSPLVRRVLGEMFRGVLICDFWGAYNKIKTLATQRCFFHLFTEFEKVSKSNKSDAWKMFHKRIMRLLGDGVRLSIRKPNMTKEGFENQRMRILIRLDALLASSDRKDKDVNRIVKRLTRHRDEIFTFLDYEGVSPYNNHGEQQIRKPVITRKISQQNRSEAGALTHAVFMSLFRSAELQGLNPIEKAYWDAKNLIAGNQTSIVSQKKAA